MHFPTGDQRLPTARAAHGRRDAMHSGVSPIRGILVGETRFDYPQARLAMTGDRSSSIISVVYLSSVGEGRVHILPTSDIVIVNIVGVCTCFPPQRSSLFQPTFVCVWHSVLLKTRTTTT